MVKKIFNRVIPILLCLFFAYARVYYYGYINDSVAVQDTESYFEAAKADFPTLEFFEQSRSATIPLFYKLCNPTLEHTIVLMAEPYFESAPNLEAQPGTEVIASAQLFISIFCWTVLALVVASCLHNWFAKAFGVLIILCFSFVPQIAEWDSILSSESLSFSFFALMIGLFLKVIPNGEKDRASDWVWSLFLFIVSALWLFTRDTNAYFVIIAAAFLVLSVVLWWIREGRLNIPPLICAFCLAGLFLFQQQTFNKSNRWELPLLNNLTTNVFPYEERVAFFEAQQMPVTPELLAQSGSAEYNELYDNELFMTWVHRFGLNSYKKFLLSMPLWSGLQIWTNLESFFNENMQPFFYGTNLEVPHWAEPIGDLLHPMSTAVILIDLILLIALWKLTFRTESGSLKRWLVLCLILFFGGGAMMCISYLGEVRSIWRHVLGGVSTLRLCMWMCLLALVGGENASGADPELQEPLG